MRPTVFLHEEYNFEFVERVAVIPFENLSNEQGAGARATRFFITNLLSLNIFDIIEPGEVTRVLSKYATLRTADLTPQQIVEIGKSLQVQSLFFGTVNETTAIRSGSSTEQVVTVVLRMVETESGQTVWSATHTAKGKSFVSSLFSNNSKSQSEVMRKCIKEAMATLVR